MKHGIIAKRILKAITVCSGEYRVVGKREVAAARKLADAGLVRFEDQGETFGEYGRGGIRYRHVSQGVCRTLEQTRMEAARLARCLAAYAYGK